MSKNMKTHLWRQKGLISKEYYQYLRSSRIVDEDFDNYDGLKFTIIRPSLDYYEAKAIKPYVRPKISYLRDQEVSLFDKIERLR